MSTAQAEAALASSAPSGLFRSLLRKHLARIRHGCVTLVDGDHETDFGDPRAELQAKVFVHDVRFYRRIILGGNVGAAESLMDGDWSSNDLTSLIRIFIRNADIADRLERAWSFCTRTLERAQHWMRRNTPVGSSRNIREHYDLGNPLFSQFLDETLNYSCGVFEHPSATMHEASLAKMDRICHKLQLSGEDHLLEIGTGWGGMAMHAAGHYGCRVTTTTISQEQHALATERIRAAGLSDRIDVQLCDYRNLGGRYDKLVSVEMVEAVGHEFLPVYFGKCCELLKPDGLMLLQGIVIRDQRYDEYRRRVDFIRKHIFPGGCLPSVTSILQSTTQATDLRLLHLEDIGPHYARTLECWRSLFHERIDAIRALGYSERFLRMWDYYLCYCQAAFEERHVNNVQMLFARPGSRVDPLQLCLTSARGGAVSDARPARCGEVCV